jgi:DNA invertase Pin-like site-specific DNA recombinase
MPKVVAYCYCDLLVEPALPDASQWGQPWGWTVTQVYIDFAHPEGMKAAPAQGSGTLRSQWQQLLSESEADPPEYLLVRRLSDLGDTLSEVGECLATLQSKGIELITLEQSHPNAATSLVTLLAAIAKDQRHQRLRQGHARNRLQAQPPPGKAPYGYRRSKDRYSLDRTTAPVVKAFFEQFILFGSLRGAVRYIEKRYGKKISPSTGRRWLENPVYRGDTAYLAQDHILRDTHLGIISREEAAQVDRLLRRNRQLPARTASAPRSLAGLVTCQTCGTAMIVAKVSTPRQTQSYLYLRAKDCPKAPKCKAIAYEQVLQTTITTICQQLPAAVAQLQRPPMAATGGGKSRITEQIQQKQAALDQLEPLVKNGVLDQATAGLRAYTLKIQIAQHQQALAQLPPVNLQELTQAVVIPQFWQDLSESERRFFFREFIKAIEIVREEKRWTINLKFIF